MDRKVSRNRERKVRRKVWKIWKVWRIWMKKIWTRWMKGLWMMGLKMKMKRILAFMAKNLMRSKWNLTNTKNYQVRNNNSSIIQMLEEKMMRMIKLSTITSIIFGK